MRVLSILLLSLLLASCGAQSSSEQATPPAEPAVQSDTDADTAAPAAVTVASAERPVMCGCSIESVGHCGNYVQIDGQNYAIANSQELGLGAMAWCGQSGVKATTAGTIVDGAFVATELAVVAAH